MGVLVPMAMLYLTFINRKKFILLFIIPLILAGSGGGLILTSLALIIIALKFILLGNIKTKMLAIVVIPILAFSVYAFVKFTFSEDVNYWIGRFIVYNTEIREQKRGAQFADAEHKLDRLYGHQFLIADMGMDNTKKMFGLGTSYKKRRFGYADIQFKNDINFILAERGYIGLGFYFLLLLWLIFSTPRRLKYFDKSIRYSGTAIVLIFALGAFYTEVTRPWHLILFLFYILTLFNYPIQVKNLLSNEKN